jgi:hypothetical protein
MEGLVAVARLSSPARPANHSRLGQRQFGETIDALLWHHMLMK